VPRVEVSGQDHSAPVQRNVRMLRGLVVVQRRQDLAGAMREAVTMVVVGKSGRSPSRYCRPAARINIILAQNEVQLAAGICGTTP